MELNGLERELQDVATASMHELLGRSSRDRLGLAEAHALPLFDEGWARNVERSVRSLLDRGAANGLLRRDVPVDVMVSFFVGMMAEAAILPVEKRRLPDLSERVVHALLHGFLPR